MLEVGPLEYEVFMPDFVRRQLQTKIGETVSLRTIEYIEGNPQQGRMTPRLVGFMSETEAEFFEVICSVDGVGVRKALRAIVRPVREVAAAIEEQNLEELVALPGSRAGRRRTNRRQAAAEDGPLRADGGSRHSQRRRDAP